MHDGVPRERLIRGDADFYRMDLSRAQRRRMHRSEKLGKRHIR